MNKILLFIVLMVTLSCLQAQERDTIVKIDSVNTLSSLKGKVKINEVFYVHELKDILRKDFWIELINVSDEELFLQDLGLSTDTVYGKYPVTNKKDNTELTKVKKGGVLLINLTSKYHIHTPYKSDLKDLGNVIYLFNNNQIIDSVVVPVLDRDQSFARLPNGTGDFVSVRLVTPDKHNTQLLPSKYTKPKSQFIHMVGLSSSNFNMVDQNIGSKHRLGANIGFAWQKSLGVPDMRIGLSLKTLGFRIKSDSTLNTDFATIKINNSGFQRMEYLSSSFELGMPMTQRLSLFYGVAINVRLNITTKLKTNIVTTRNDGTEVSNNTTYPEYGFVPEQVDLMTNIGLEYKIVDELLLNLSYSKDFAGFLIGDSSFADNSLRTNLFELKLIVPLHQSRKVVNKFILFDQYESLK